MKSDEKLIEGFVNWLRESFPRLRFEVKMSLKKLFPKPSNKYLQPFWNDERAHADISVFRHDNLVCVIEPGGWQHQKVKRRMTCDKKKARICSENGVSYLPLMNSCMKYRDLKQFRKLLKCYFYQRIN